MTQSKESIEKHIIKDKIKKQKKINKKLNKEAKMLDKTAKIHEKQVKNIQKRAKITPTDSITLANTKTLNLIKTFSSSKEFQKISLTPQQLQDNDFLLKLYQINPEITKTIPPTKNFTASSYHMAELLKTSFHAQFEAEKAKNSNPNKELILKELFHKYRSNLIETPQILDQMTKILPDVNIIYCFRNSSSSFLYNPNSDQGYTKTMLKLTNETLENQAQKFGAQSLCFYPQNLPNYLNYIKKGINRDGFKSLNILHTKQILQNKDLIVEAYKIDGFTKLNKFITTLSICKDIKSNENLQTNKYSIEQIEKINNDIRQEILQDKRIQQIFRIEEQKSEQKHSPKSKDEFQKL